LLTRESGTLVNVTFSDGGTLNGTFTRGHVRFRRWTHGDHPLSGHHAGSGSHECNNCGVYWGIVTGSLDGNTVPEPGALVLAAGRAGSVASDAQAPLPQKLNCFFVVGAQSKRT
jgi:hypothetical protein